MSELYAQKTTYGFDHIYPSTQAVKMCTDKPDIWRVRVEESETGDYWGWWSNGRSDYSMIFRSRVQVSICFPYGPEIEEKLGRGRIVRLSVTAIKPVSS